MGTMSVGGITNGIYTTDAPRQVEYIVNDSGTRFFFAEDEEQLDKILESRAACPGLVKIFVFDMDGLHNLQDPQVMPFETLLALGARYNAEPPCACHAMAELAPALFFAVPRIWEKFSSAVALRMRAATWPGRLAYRWAIGVGTRAAEARLAGRRPSLALRLLFRLADFLVLDNVKRSMGLHR